MDNTVQPQALTQDIGDVELQYLQYDGQGDTILLLHATGFLPWLWHPLARTLAPTYRVIAPYFCDHRETDPDKGGLNWMVLAKDFVTFCERQKIEQPFLVGHSMGATVLTIAVGAYGLKAKGLLLIEPIFLPEEFYGMKLSVTDHPLASRSIKRRDYWKDPSEAQDYLKSRSLFKNWDEEILNLYLSYGMEMAGTGGLTLACSPAREAALFMGGMHYDPWPILPKIKCPVLVVEGEQSENHNYIDLRKAVSLFPKGTYRLVEGAGHLIPMEKPGITTALITEFIQNIKDEPH